MTKTNIITEEKIKHDGTISIATGASSKTKTWKNKTMQWSELVEKLSHTTRTPETVAEYKKLSKAEKGKIKDVGGFVGGCLKNGRRLKGNVQNRTLLTLDLDYIQGDIWSSIELLYDFSVVMYSTHTHTADNQRLRLIIPLSRPVLPDEYQAIGRMVADDLGIDQFDDTTYEPERLMYWASTPSDGDFIFKYQDLPWLNPDDILSRYTFGWQDISYWPESSRVRAKISSAIKKQEDPLTKKGIIGAFCRTYTITEAISEFLNDIYVSGADETRYTYAEGSTTGGVVIYDDKFSYSHHGTDPASNTLCNAFDLVRIHKFGHLDEEAKERTPVNKMPSFTKMSEFAADDKKVIVTIGKEKMQAAQEDFDIVPEDNKDIEWVKKLRYTDLGKLRSTVENFKLIIENEPLLKGKIALNEFLGRPNIRGQLPWRSKGNFDEWNDTDEDGLGEFIEKYYGIYHIQKCRSGLNLAIEHNRFNPVKDYFETLDWDGTPRLESLFVDYLGAEDTAYTRTITRKTLIAAVRRVYNPGYKFDTMLVLYGEQGVGKSSILRKLAILPEWFSDANVDISKDSNIIQGYRGKLIIEIAEMSGFNKRQLGEIKSFITRQSYEDRLAYARNSTNYKVQYILFGTTNDKNCLADKTGNRRFWVLDVGTFKPAKDIFRDLNNFEIGQIWAEAIALEKNEGALVLDRELSKVAAKTQEEHMVVDELRTKLEDVLDWDAPKEKWEYHTYTEICRILELSDRMLRNAKNSLKPELNKYGIEQELKKHKRVYCIPPKYYEEF